MSSTSSDDGCWHRGKLPLLALPVWILSSGGRSGPTGSHHVSEALPILWLQQDEKDGMQHHWHVDHAVKSHLSLYGGTHGHVSVLVASVSKLTAVHLHQLVDVVGSPAEEEEAEEENHDEGGPAVGRVQSWRSGSTELHQKGDEGEADENGWHDEAGDEESEKHVGSVAHRLQGNPCRRH